MSAAERLYPHLRRVRAPQLRTSAYLRHDAVRAERVPIRDAFASASSPKVRVGFFGSAILKLQRVFTTGNACSPALACAQSQYTGMRSPTLPVP